MTTGRVLATQEARDAVSKLKGLVTGDLLTTIGDLEKQGDILADPNEWDGGLAKQFRDAWPDNKTTIDNMQQDLKDMQEKIDKILENIRSAGGD